MTEDHQSKRDFLILSECTSGILFLFGSAVGTISLVVLFLLLLQAFIAGLVFSFELFRMIITVLGVSGILARDTEVVVGRETEGIG